MKEQQMKDKKALRLFLVLTIGVSVILEAVYVILYYVTGYKYMVVMVGIMWAPNSVLPALFVHASHNLFDQMVFQSMSTKESVPYLAGEQGAVTVLFTAVIAGIAICFWKQK